MRCFSVDTIGSAKYFNINSYQLIACLNNWKELIIFTIDKEVENELFIYLKENSFEYAKVTYSQQG